jgi:N-acetylglucosaminyl-diphospho-decaprenol L-rhamnosyltransferase
MSAEASRTSVGAGAVAGVVVNYNAKDHLLACVGSLLREGLAPVVVVDNGSRDGSERALRDRYPSAKWAPTGANLGYGSAVDVGADLAGTPYVLVCNPDVIVGSGAVAVLRDYLTRHPRAAVVGPRIVDSDGDLYPSARRFPDLVESIGHGIVGQFWPGNPYSRRYRMTDWDHADAMTVDWVSGACFLARKEAWDEVGGFDRSYFMYMEDVDLCWRLRGAGWEVGYEPGAAVVHVQGASADRHPFRMLFAHHVSLWRFACRTTPADRRWVLPLVLPGLAVRFGLTAGRKAFSEVRSQGSERRSAAGRSAR